MYNDCLYCYIYHKGESDCRVKMSPSSEAALLSNSPSNFSSSSNVASSSLSSSTGGQYSFGEDYASYYRSYPAMYMGTDPYGLRKASRPTPYARGSEYAAYQAAARLNAGYARTAPVTYGFDSR